jgi:methionine synthase II (cobalamin-independent)
VTVFDAGEASLKTVKERIATNLRDLGDDPRAVERVTPIGDLAASVRDADYVVEAVSEDLPLKQKLFAEIETHVRPDTILASNTSVIPITQIMGGLKRRERALGTHWWNPPFLVPLVEVIGTEWTSPQAIDFTECADFRDILDELVASPQAGGFVETFLTAPSPGIVAAAIRNEHYDTEDAYLVALGRALQVEYEAIVTNGFLLQLDCPDLALERHISYQDRPLSDFLDFVERVVATINEALRNIPRDRVRMHACWGNYEGPHDCDVPLDDILPIIKQMNVGGFVLPFANPRHAHEIRCLETYPLADDQIVVAGVIDTLTNFVEHPQVVADRLERVARSVGDPRRVTAGTDCGFDTSAGAGRVAEDVVWAKLAALSEGARIASERLFHPFR